MQLTVVLAQGRDDDLVIPLDVNPTQTLGELKNLIEPLFGIEKDKQQIIHNNRRLQNESATLESVGLTDGDMISVTIQQPPPPIPARTSQQQQRTSGTNQGIADEAETIRLQALGEPAILNQLRSAEPSLADAVNDPRRFSELWTQLRNAQNNQQTQQQQREAQLRARLEADPFDIEAQRELEEGFRLEEIQKNFEFAIEYSPEVFGRVHMLYIPVEINGVAVKAFVDSGAQSTIMNPACAERCNVMRLVDTRFSGVAKGVGTAAILGRVHSAQMKIGNSFFSSSFTVIEGKDVELLLGLDMLKRYQASIDLKANVLRIHDAEVSFLAENELPIHAREIQEPTVAGPSGMRIGAESGAVIPPGQASSSHATSGGGSGAPTAQSASGSASAAARSYWGQQGATGPGAATGTATQSASNSESAQKIETLVGMGFSRVEAENALQMAGGNVELAASMLYGGD